MYNNWLIALEGRVFTNGPGDRDSDSKIYTWYLLLKTQLKRSLQVTLDYSNQIYFI